MKRLLTAGISLVFSVFILLSLASCGDDVVEVEDSTTVPTAITVPNVEDEVKSDDAKKQAEINESKKKSIKNVSTKIKYDIKPKYQEMLEKKIRDNAFNGIVRVSKHGKVVCEAVNGTMSTKSKDKIKKDTQFAIASCSKQFTAAAIMILKDDGKLKVFDTLDKYFPKYKHAKKLTIKNLLTMRSGIPDFLNENSDFRIYNIKKNASEKKNREATLKWIFSKDLHFRPNGMYEYCNSNYFLLAEIVEKVSGMSFSEFLRERIFYPLGMDDTDANEVLAYSKRLAISDRDPWDLPGVPENKQPLTIRVKGLSIGNGGLVSTAADLDQWLTSMRKHKIISESSVKEMSKDYNKDSEHYGYGVKVTNDGAVWHVGALDYYASFTYTIPKKGYNFVAITNDKKSMNSDIYTFAFGIINSTK